MPKKSQPTSSGTCCEVAFEEIEHTADRALDTGHTPGSAQQEKTVVLDTLDAESLLVEWLNELAYWAESELLVFNEFEIKNVSPTHLTARIRGTRATHLEKHINMVLLECNRLVYCSQMSKAYSMNGCALLIEAETSIIRIKMNCAIRESRCKALSKLHRKAFFFIIGTTSSKY